MNGRLPGNSTEKEGREESGKDKVRKPLEERVKVLNMEESPLDLARRWSPVSFSSQKHFIRPTHDLYG